MAALGFVHCPNCMEPHTDPAVIGGQWVCDRCGQYIDADEDDADDDSDDTDDEEADEDDDDW